MKNFWKSKKFWLILFALIIIGFFVYIFWFSEEEIPLEEILTGGGYSEEIKSDKSEPASQIRSPDSGLWLSRGFEINVLDEDLESGLDKDSCQYKVLSYGLNGTEHSTGWQSRKCNSFTLIEVGQGKACSFEGQKACWVYVRSADKAGNWHLAAEEKGSIKYFNIDWTLPEVGRVSIENNRAQVSVLDNFKVAACNLYLDNKNLGLMSFLVPGCQKECQAYKDLEVEFESGESKIFAVCKDAAGNYGRGEELVIKENLAPEISFCRVIPAQGSTQTDFQFQVEASDPDQDLLFYLWDFGDGQSSQEKNPFHNYSEIGTFEPKVKVLDDQGGEDICSTAWVVVE